jgi:hypothetical protein
MKTNFKDKSIIYIIGAVAVGVIGYFGYKKYMDGKLPTPTPEPTPEPTPKTTPNKKGTTPQKASAAKIDELQKLMIRRFVQRGIENEYTANDAKGGFGSKSMAALKKLQPINYSTKGNPNAMNIDFWIKSLAADIETAARDIAQNKTKQTSVEQLKKLSKDIVAFLKTGGRAKVINEFTAVQHQFDAVKKTYIPLSGTKTFRKGLTFDAGELVDRQNGQIMITSGEYRYPTSPQNLLTFKK